MATHSKIRPIRALVPPLSQQNQRILGKPFPLTHPCARHLREKTCRFHVHLRFALGQLPLAHLIVICVAVANFRSSTPNDLLLIKFTSPNQATYSTLPDNQRPHRTFPLIYQQNNIYKSVTHIQNVFLKKRKTQHIFNKNMCWVSTSIFESDLEN